MRSPAEIKFRVRQEFANLYLWLKPPRFSGHTRSNLALPNGQAVVDALRNTTFESAVLATAQRILAHQFPLLGVTVDTGPEIEWRKDYAHNKVSGTSYFRFIPYLTFSAVGDHKFIWELNRHQHLVLLAQAHLFTGSPEYIAEIFRQIESWLVQNRFQCGINWASSLEVAFRALSWIWIWHFCSDAMPGDLKPRFLISLYQHGRHLAENLSVYFSPNTHLLGEAVALHALGVLFGDFPESGAWVRRGSEIVEAQLHLQIQADGSHFEQSSYYHVYAVDLFAFHYVLADRPRHFEPILSRMADYLDWLLGPARRIAFLGDDDGGRLFHPFGARDEFGRATLATCGILLNNVRWVGSNEEISQQAAWWLGPDSFKCISSQQPPAGSRSFLDSGSVFLQSCDFYIQFDAGPFGWGAAGHSHADTLSLVAWFRGEPLLLDPGTFTYISDPIQRNAFRGTAAHNTVCIDRQNQAKAADPFRWAQKPKVKLTAFKPTPRGGFADGCCAYSGFTHRRRVLLNDSRLLVLDEIKGPVGDHECRQLWQLGPAASQVHFCFSAPVADQPSEISSAYGIKFPSKASVVTLKGSLPQSIAMQIDLNGYRELTIDSVREEMDSL